MTSEIGSATNLPLHDHTRAVAIAHFGRFGFDQSMLEMSFAADVDVATLSELFGSIDNLRATCDEYVRTSMRGNAVQALGWHDPTTWFAAGVDSAAHLMAYLVRTLRAGDDSARSFLQQMIDDTTRRLAAAVRAGTVTPTQDPRGRARFVVTSGVGGFLLYQRTHRTPDDMVAVLGDYARVVLEPATELYGRALMTEETAYPELLGRPATNRSCQGVPGDQSL